VETCGERCVYGRKVCGGAGLVGINAVHGSYATVTPRLRQRMRLDCVRVFDASRLTVLRR
jgi:hypothetical protein